jgi:hypothetical protein
MLKGKTQNVSCTMLQLATNYANRVARSYTIINMSVLKKNYSERVLVYPPLLRGKNDALRGLVGCLEQYQLLFSKQKSQSRTVCCLHSNSTGCVAGP